MSAGPETGCESRQGGTRIRGAGQRNRPRVRRPGFPSSAASPQKSGKSAPQLANHWRFYSRSQVLKRRIHGRTASLESESPSSRQRAEQTSAWLGGSITRKHRARRIAGPRRHPPGGPIGAAGTRYSLARLSAVRDSERAALKGCWFGSRKKPRDRPGRRAAQEEVDRANLQARGGFYPSEQGPRIAEGGIRIGGPFTRWWRFGGARWWEGVASVERFWPSAQSEQICSASSAEGGVDLCRRNSTGPCSSRPRDHTGPRGSCLCRKQRWSRTVAGAADPLPVRGGDAAALTGAGSGAPRSVAPLQHEWDARRSTAGPAPKARRGRPR